MLDIKDKFDLKYNTKKTAIHFNANISDVSIDQVLNSCKNV